jgi:uncharacterized protein (DUF1330 family)
MPKGYIYAEVAVFDALRYEHWRYRVVESIAKAGGRFIVRRGDPRCLRGTTSRCHWCSLSNSKAASGRMNGIARNFR